MTRIAIIGLANSHPRIDARNLASLRPGVRFLVQDEDPARVQDFLAEHPERAEQAATVADVVDAGCAAALVTVPPAQVASLVGPLLEASTAVLITKPAATTTQELEALDAAVRGHEDRVLTCSPLRMAPAVAAQLRALGDATVAARAHAAHDIGYWTRPENRWQDEAGGLVPMMGVHALDLLELALGPSLRVTACTTGPPRDGVLTSPWHAEGRAKADGRQAVFTLDGAVGGQHYTLEIDTADGTRTIALGEGGQEDPFGFRTLAGHLLAMAGGAPSPLPWPRSRAVLQAVADATRLSRRSEARDQETP